MEARKIAFRNYLETTGAIKALTEALVKLFDLAEKPEDSVSFLRMNLGDQPNPQEENTRLKEELEEALKRVREVEYLLNIRSDGEVTLSDEKKKEILLANLEALQQDSECTSLLKKHLTKELVEELADVKTEVFQSSLHDCLLGPKDGPPIKVIAVDADCYSAFEKVFNPVIRDIFHLPEDFEHPQPDWGNADEIGNPDVDGNFIEQCGIRCTRSIEGFPFLPKMNADQFRDVMTLVQTTLHSLNETEFKGTFYAYETEEDETRARFIEDGVLFENHCEKTEAIGCHRLWPIGRAAFVSDDKIYWVQINNEDHLRFGCEQKNGDLKKLYERMIAFSRVFDETLHTVRHLKYGFLTSRPLVLGHAMEIRVNIKLAKLPNEPEKMQAILANHSLKTTAHGEPGEDGRISLEVKSTKCLGATEFETIKEFVDGLAELVQAEKE